MSASFLLSGVRNAKIIITKAEILNFILHSSSPCFSWTICNLKLFTQAKSDKRNRIQRLWDLRSLTDNIPSIDEFNSLSTRCSIDRVVVQIYSDSIKWLQDRIDGMWNFVLNKRFSPLLTFITARLLIQVESPTQFISPIPATSVNSFNICV